MNNREKLIVTLAGTLVACSLTGYRALANAQTKSDSSSDSVFYQPQSAIDGGNTVNGSSTAEIPGGNVDYSVYEPYGLLYDQENHYYTYNGNIVRFFNDSMAGASFTNSFSGIVDIEAEYDSSNKLIGIKECSKEVYDWHTQKNSRISSLAGEATAQVGGTSSQIWLKDYADYGITYNNTQSGDWCYNGQRIKFLMDGEQPQIYVNEENGNGICISVIRNGNNEISEIKEISEQDAQSFMQNNNPAGEDYTTQE